MVRKAAAKKATPVRAKKAPAKKAPARKAAPRKAAPRKAAAKKAATKKASPARSRSVATPSNVSDRDHLVATIQAKSNSSKKAAREMLETVLDTVTVSLKKNGKVQLAGFGSFTVVKRAARKGRNPATGEAIRVKASKGVRFKAGSKLKAGI